MSCSAIVSVGAMDTVSAICQFPAMALSSSHAEMSVEVPPSDGHRAELVGPVSPISDDETMTIAQAAKLAGVSPATVHRRIVEGELPATRDGRVYKITRKTVLEIGPALRKRDSKADRARDVGALAARLFPLLAAGMPLDDCVIRLEADPAEVRKLFAEWLQCRHLSAQYLTPATTPTTPPEAKR